MSFVLRIGSRPSALAMAQATAIKDMLGRIAGGLAIEIVPIRTSGDKMQSASLAQVGGKGLFIRELEQALGARRIELALHSMKDLPAILPSDYRLLAVPPRESAHDVLITPHDGGLVSLPESARVGTSSNRRRYEAMRLRSDLQMLPLRGNIDTRLQRLTAGDFDAIILARAGLTRLGIEFGASGSNGPNLTATDLDSIRFVPSGGQGALAIEALRQTPVAGSHELEAIIARLDDLPTLAEVTAERAFLATIGASCVSPVGVNGIVGDHKLQIRALLFSLDGSRSLAGELVADLISDAQGRSTRAEVERIATDAGTELGRRMLERGAGELIRE